MPDKLTFPTVTLLSFTRKPTRGTAKLSGSVTAAISKAMGWTDIPECATSTSLEGELDVSLAMLTPKDKALERHAVDLDCSKVSKFQLVRRELEGKKGKGYRQELHFVVWFSDPNGARKLEQYMLAAGKSTLVISYTKQAVQADLPGTSLKDEADEAQASLQ